MRERCCVTKPTVDLGGIDVQQIGVTQYDLRRIAEIQHELRLGAGAADSRCSERPHSQASDVI